MKKLYVSQVKSFNFKNINGNGFKVDQPLPEILSQRLNLIHPWWLQVELELSHNAQMFFVNYYSENY